MIFQSKQIKIPTVINTNTFIVFRPLLYLPCGTNPSFVVRCHPTLFQLKKNLEGTVHPEPWYSLPYRIVFAIGTKTEVIIYDTQHQGAIGRISGYHLASITDLAWYNETLVVSSRDAFCSVTTFSENELGMPYEDAMEEE